MDDGGPQLQLPLAALMGSGKIIAIARLAFFISRDYIFLFTERHPGVEKLEVMLVNTDLVSNSQRKTKFIWCARKIRTLLGRFARARKFLDRGTRNTRSPIEIRKPECSNAQYPESFSRVLESPIASTFQGKVFISTPNFTPFSHLYRSPLSGPAAVLAAVESVAVSAIAWSCGCVVGFGWMVVRFVRVLRVPACGRCVSRPLRCLFTGPPGVFLRIRKKDVV